MAVMGLVFNVIFSFFAISTAYSSTKHAIKTERPIIGILAETTHGKFADYGKAYIAASYVKYIESAGARVVPILPDLPADQIEKLFHSINGVIFPGGGVDLTKSGYAKNGKLFYDLAIKAFDNGDVFPVWGSCLGFELLTVLTSDDKVIFSHVDAEDLPLPLNFNTDYEDSRLFSNVTSEISKSLEGLYVTMNNHKYSVTPEDFGKDNSLSSFYKVLSTNKDRQGKEFVSTIEAHTYPFYGVQWHPEKNQFEWSRHEAIPHSSQAVQVGQYMANFLVNQARLNDHHFENPAEAEDALIYNYNPTYTGSFSNFTQCYFFNY